MNLSDANIIVAGHVCLDLIPELTEDQTDMSALVAPGRLVRVGPAHVSLGGAVANVGLALHRLGAAVRLLGKTGDDPLGVVLRDLLRQVAAHLPETMIVAPGEATSYSVVISPPGVDRCFLHAPAANDTFRPGEIDVSAFRRDQIFHFGYPPIMQACYDDGGHELAELFARLRSRGVLTSLDMAMPDPNSPAGQVDWRDWLAGVLPHVDLFAPSFDETLFMVDRGRFDEVTRDADGGNPARLAGLPTIQSTATQLLELGARTVALKLGDEGLYLRSSDDAEALATWRDRQQTSADQWRGCELLVPCFATTCVGATGSGDATVAGLLNAIARGSGPERAVLAAAGVGACSVEQADATSGVPTWQDLQQRLETWEQRAVGWPLADLGWRRGERIWCGPHNR